MKKILTAILVAISCVCFAIGFVGCGKPNDAKDAETTYSTTWTQDATYHWHKATNANSTEISAKGEHDFVKGICSVCGYKMTRKIDVEKVAEAFTDNAYTVTVKFDDEEIKVVLDVKNLVLKAAKDQEKIQIDESGIYSFDDGVYNYIAIKPFALRAFKELMGMSFESFVEMVNYFLPEGWTFDDLVSIVYNGKTFAFNEQKAMDLVNTLAGFILNEGVTLDNVVEQAQDGLTYEEVVAIFKPNVIESINAMLPENMPLPVLMAFLVNVTPANLETFFNALCAGELNEETVCVILPEGMNFAVIDSMISMFFPDFNVKVEQIVEVINSAVKYINSIDYEAIYNQLEIEAIDNFNKALDTFFIEEKAGSGVKYMLKYAVIKDANEYLYTKTLEEIINGVVGDGTVDAVKTFSDTILSSKLSELKAALEAELGMTLEDALDKALETVEEYTPIIEKCVDFVFGEDTEIAVYDLFEMVTSAIKPYLEDEDFMDMTVREAIIYFAGNQQFTEETLNGYIDTAFNYIKEKTVYDVIGEFEEDFDKTEIYAKINEVADYLTENCPVYFVIDAAGELSELSVTLGGDEMEMPIAFTLNKGDLLGEIYTKEEKDMVAEASTKYTIDDFTGYEYTYTDEYEGEITVKVTIDKYENGFIVITRERNSMYVEETTDYGFEEYDFASDFITVGENGEIEYGLENDYDYLTIIFDVNGKGYLEEDFWFMGNLIED